VKLCQHVDRIGIRGKTVPLAGIGGLHDLKLEVGKRTPECESEFIVNRRVGGGGCTSLPLPVAWDVERLGANPESIQANLYLNLPGRPAGYLGL
jgi:hypothetical protein